MLQVKSIFGPTIQGEGAQSGWPAIFIRFAGCNMWNGKPETRTNSKCPFCDTNFLGGTPMTVEEILRGVVNLVPVNGPRFLVVLTGGEPLLQPDAELIELVQALHQLGHVTQIETNGTKNALVLNEIRHVTVSPKLPFSMLKVRWDLVTCLKILHPHPTVDYAEFLHLQKVPGVGISSFYIQPIEMGTSLQSAANVRSAVALVKHLGYPWRLSLQTHKMIGEE